MTLSKFITLKKIGISVYIALRATGPGVLALFVLAPRFAILSTRSRRSRS
jgi:hypothetical protein